MSLPFSIDGLDLQKVLKGLLIGLAGVAVAVLTQLMGAKYTFHYHAYSVDYTMVMMVVYSAVINTLRKFIASN